jgi:hypothetical protein
MEAHANQQMPSYWPAVLSGGAIGAVVVSMVTFAAGYIMLSSEPTGSPFNISSISGIFGCLIGAVAGVYANRMYAKDNELTYPIGKGALIGLWSGIALTVISSLISLLWVYVIDPGYAQASVEWQKMNADMMQIPAEQKEIMMQSFENPYSMKNILLGLGIGSVVFGIVNAISGIIGAKLFASED